MNALVSACNMCNFGYVEPIKMHRQTLKRFGVIQWSVFVIFTFVLLGPPPCSVCPLQLFGAFAAYTTAPWCLPHVASQRHNTGRLKGCSSGCSSGGFSGCLSWLSGWAEKALWNPFGMFDLFPSFSYSAGQAGGVLVTSNLRPLDSMPPFDAAAVSCGLLRAVQTSKLCSKSLPRWGDLLQDIPKELITYQRESHMFSPEYNKYERVGKGKTPYHGRFDMYSQQSLTDLQWLVKNPKRQSVLLFYHIFDGHLLSFAHNCWTQEVLVSTRSGSKMDHELPGHSWSFLVSIHGFHNCGAAYLVQRCAA